MTATYTLLAQPYQDWIRSRLFLVKSESREWWDLRTELDSVENYKHELVIVSDVSPKGLVQVRAKHGGLTKIVPFKALAKMEPQPAKVAPPLCPVPFAVGQTVEIMFVKMVVTNRRQNGNTWEYEAKPVNKHESYWAMPWYPHSLCQDLA